MKNPCKQCLVKSMCKDMCILYEEYIEDIVLKKCTFDVNPRYHTPLHLWGNINGGVQLTGYFKGKRKSIDIYYRNRGITSIRLKENYTNKFIEEIYKRGKDE